ELIHLLSDDAERQESEFGAGAERINSEFRRQHEHHEDESGRKQRRAERNRDAMPDLDDRQARRHLHHMFAYWIHVTPPPGNSPTADSRRAGNRTPSRPR